MIAGEMTIAEAARRERISEQSIGRWKADFLEAGKTALVAGKSFDAGGTGPIPGSASLITMPTPTAANSSSQWPRRHHLIRVGGCPCSLVEENGALVAEQVEHVTVACLSASCPPRS